MFFCFFYYFKILLAEAEENNLGTKVYAERWEMWHDCQLCEQRYHGVVLCALGWASWKTYVGRVETDRTRSMAMNLLGNGLHSAYHYEDALTVREAELSMLRRLGAPGPAVFAVQSNLGHSECAAKRASRAPRPRDAAAEECVSPIFRH